MSTEKGIEGFDEVGIPNYNNSTDEGCYLKSWEVTLYNLIFFTCC